MSKKLIGNCFFPIFLLVFGLAGCAPGMKFITQGDVNGEFFDEADRGEEVTGKPALNLVAGEKLVYDVSWIGISVGKIILENRGLEEVEGEEAYHLTFVTLSNKFLSNFFKIEDTVHTWVSREGGYPLRFEKQVKEGHYSKHQVVKYDHDNLLAFYQRKDKNGEIKSMSIPPQVQDVFSTLYWVRRQDLTLGEELVLDVNADKKNWVVKIEVVDRGVLETEAMGRSRAFVLEPSATHEGKALEKGKMRVWMTAGRRRIPLAFKVKTPIFGSARAILTEAILPPLSEYRFVAAKEAGESLLEVYRIGVWLNGLTQADACRRFSD